MKKRHIIAIAATTLYVIACQIAGFMLLHICDNYIGEDMLPVPKECQIYNATGLANNVLVYSALAAPLIVFAIYAKYGWPKDKHSGWPGHEE